MGTFYELVLIFGAVAAGGLLAERLRVPLLTVYLVTGLILGPAVYGDVDDEGLFDRLPLGEAKWVVCTIPSVEVARKIVSALKIREWHGHIAVTVLEEEHETALEKIGAHVILRPDLDGAELAAEALNDAADIRFWLPGWPVGFREVRLSAESCFVGKPLREVPVRSETGAIIVAISRGAG